MSRNKIGKRILEYFMPTTRTEMLDYVAILVELILCFISMYIYCGNISPVLILAVYLLLNTIVLLVYFWCKGGNGT